MIRRRLPLAFLLMAALVGALGLIGLEVAFTITDEFNNIVTNEAPELLLLGEMRATTHELLNQAEAVTLLHAERLFLPVAERAPVQTLIQAETRQFQTALENLNDQLDLFSELTAGSSSHPNEADRHRADDLLAAGQRLQRDAIALMRVATEGERGQAVIDARQTLAEAEDIMTGLLDDARAYALAELEADQQHANDNVAQILSSTVILSAAAFGLAGLLSYVSNRSIVRPIRQLERTAVAIEHGDFDTRAPVSSRGEIGTLAGAFNTMLDTLQKRSSELADLNATLEQRVADRTAALRVATAEAREANRLKDEFLATMSHELRTPLNAIIGHLGIIMMFGDIEDKHMHRLTRVRVNAERLLNLINDVLDLSRIEAGRYRLTPMAVNIREKITSIKDNVGILAEEKTIDFNLTIAANVPPVVSIDEDALTKIVSNLLSNAFKFTDEGSVTLNVSSTPTDLVLAVTDTGVGIPAHMHEIIFERFRQADGSTTRVHGGSGLGLSIVQNIVQLMNGTIQLESEPGAGSTFTVTLPLVVPALQPEATP